MPPEESSFQTFFAAKLKERNISLKKLAEATGIAQAHLESLLHGRIEDLPSAPYVRGDLVRIGKTLDFDGEAWWERVRKEGLVRNSGPADALPSNRFIKRSPAKFVWVGVLALVIVAYLAFQIPIIFGKPSVRITFPAQNPYQTASNTLAIQGVASGADSLTLNGDSVMVAQDGSWQKTVLLQDGMNTFQIAAKKLLGGETDITQQVWLQETNLPPAASSTATSTTP